MITAFSKRLLCVFMILSLATATCCANDNPQAVGIPDVEIVINAAEGYRYYDDYFQKEVVAFELLEDGGYRFLTEEEVRSYDDDAMTDEALCLDASSECLFTPYAVNDFRDYYEYYVFNQTAGPTVVNGNGMQVSGWVVSGSTGSTITMSSAFSVSESFSASVSTAEMKAAVRAGASITWINTATRTTSYSLTAEPNSTACLYFRPKLNRVKGNLSLYSNWDGLISTTYNHYGYSVKKLSSGDPDGTFYLVYQ